MKLLFFDCNSISLDDSLTVAISEYSLFKKTFYNPDGVYYYKIVIANTTYSGWVEIWRGNTR